jgi:hypothetical protein
MRKNLPAVGQSYKHDDLPLSAQRTSNWFPEINQETSVVVSLQPFPGASIFTSREGVDRGVTLWNGSVYKVTDTSLWKYAEDGTETIIGPIAGTRRCVFPASEFYLVIVSSGFVYTYDGASLVQVTDVDLESPNYGAYLNSFWIYQGTGARWCSSDAGAPGTINGLNYATAESKGGVLIRPYVYDQLVYFFCDTYIEQWWNSGSTSPPPFDRVEGGVINVGLAAADSLDSNDQFMYFLGDDRRVYQMVGTQKRSISTIPLAQAFQAYDDVSDAVGFCFQWNGQDFYSLTAGGKTWCFAESAGGWFEITVGNDEPQWPATGYVYAWGKHLIADGGNLLELGGNLYNGLPVIRERVTGLISGETFGEEMIGRSLFMSRAEIIIKGTPPVGDAPQLMLSWSDDAGYTWSNERIITCGVLGDYTFKAIAFQLGRFYSRVFRVRISDENNYSLHRMSGDIDGGY